MSSHYLKYCLCCDSDNLRLVLDLGLQPPANSYFSNNTEPPKLYPLGLNVCVDCWHAQLTYCLDRNEIFDNYAYVSGTSGTLKRYFKWFASCIADQLPKGARVLEIAANDGSLIREMQALNIDCVGIDPASNIVNQARAGGLNLIHGYWPSIADEVVGDFDVIICMNVVAHVDDPKSFISRCKSKLKPGGILLIQPSQARMFGNYEFDTCYHEHISFFNTNSMRTLAASVGLSLVGTTLVKIHGDSPIYMICNPDAPAKASLLNAFCDGEFYIPEDLPQYEKSICLFDWSTYVEFSNRAKSTVKLLSEEVNRRRIQGFQIAFVGAAAKAMTVINSSNIKPDFFFDENPMKIGLYAPGVGTLIEDLTACQKLTTRTFFVITAWNFAAELVSKLRALDVPSGSIYFVYYPIAKEI